MTDQPILSPTRVLRAIRRWVWWTGNEGLCFPFWYFIRFEGRPKACAVWDQVHGPPEVWVRKGVFE